MDQSADVELEPGLHVRTDPRPLLAAPRMAEELGGRLCTTGAEAEALLDELAGVPSLDDATLANITALARRVQAAERIVGRTVDRAAEAVGERMAAAGTGMAIHPSAVRERAGRVLAAREVAAGAEERLRGAEEEAARADAAAPPAPPPSAPLPVASTVDEPPARRRWRFSFGRRRRDEPEDTSESTSLLQQVAASTDEVFGARRASGARRDQLLLLRAQRDRAMEDVRVAERGWRDLAGDDPVEDVEAVVRRFDPQHQDALAVAQETVGVRAVSTLLDAARAAWVAAWRAAGYEEPAATPADVAALGGRRAVAVVLAGDAVDRAEQVVAAAPWASVVVVEASS